MNTYFDAQGASHAKVASGNLVPNQSVTQIQCRNKLLHKHSAGTTVGAHLHQNVGIVALDEVDHGSNLRELSDLRSHSA